jgi:hypothetical protein
MANDLGIFARFSFPCSKILSQLMWSFGIMLSFQGCDQAKNFDEVPSIRLLQVFPSQLREGVDTLYVKVHYEDGDGDLGKAVGDTDFTITDTRQGTPFFPPVVYPYALPDVTPPGQKKQIYGEIEIKVVPTYRRPGLPTDTARISLRLRDRKGNFSNTLSLDPIPVQAP